jgi:hypothetical protein
MTRVVLLEQRVKVLEASVERQEERKRQSRSQLQHGGVLQVQEAQNLILAREEVNLEVDA